MWAIRILSGSQAGQIFPLSAGKLIIGRAPSCELKIDSNSVSKEHAAILVTGDKVILSDLNSRNGTFVNGVRIQNLRINLGDKISLHDILLDVLRVPDVMANSGPVMPTGGIYPTPPPAWAGNAAMQLQYQQNSQPQATNYSQPSVISQSAPHAVGHASSQPAHAPTAMNATSLGALFYNFKIYIDNVAMPGVYVLAQATKFRFAIGGMLLAYAIIATALSTIPVVTTTKNNIRQESLRRAKTIARNMAANNRAPLIEHNDVQLSVRAAELEEGITLAVLVSAKDGTILAPASKRQEFVNKPFVNRARREEREVAEFLDDSTLGVSIPISVYRAENGDQTVIAYAVVLYDMGALAMNTTQTLVLFMQDLLIAILVGLVLYFFLYKVIEHPLELVNTQLDEALREGRDDLKTEYQYPALERLVSNINSALSRIGSGDPNKPVAFVANRDVESTNVVRMLTAAALAVNAVDDRVIASNSAFDKLVGGGVNLQGRSLTEIPDVALQENLRDLLPRMRANLGEISLSEIPFAGEKYEICGQAVMGNAEEAAYFLIVINPLGNS